MASKRDRLVETAEGLFYREGFHATGIDRVTAETGVARMTLYNHFPSKDALVLAVLERRESTYWSRLNAAVEDARAHGHSTVLALFDAHGRWLLREGRHGCMFFKAIGEYGAHSKAVADAAADHKRRLIAYLQKLLVEDGRAASEALAEQLALLMEGATMYAQILSPEQAAEHATAAARRLLDLRTPA